MLIDTKGRIVFKGHPSTRKNLEEDFDTLLKGESIKGEGAWVEEALADSEAPEAVVEQKDGYKTVYDDVAITKSMDDFKTLAEEWVNNT